MIRYRLLAAYMTLVVLGLVTVCWLVLDFTGTFSVYVIPIVIGAYVAFEASFLVRDEVKERKKTTKTS